MKEYIDKEQTVKLMELGFPEPEHISKVRYYSIGELIEFLPHSYSKNGTYTKNGKCFRLDIFPARSGWFVLYSTLEREESHRIFKRELVDALFEMCVTLKEEGVI